MLRYITLLFVWQIYMFCYRINMTHSSGRYDFLMLFNRSRSDPDPTMTEMSGGVDVHSEIFSNCCSYNHSFTGSCIILQFLFHYAGLWIDYICHRLSIYCVSVWSGMFYRLSWWTKGNGKTLFSFWTYETILYFALAGELASWQLKLTELVPAPLNITMTS